MQSIFLITFVVFCEAQRYGELQDSCLDQTFAEKNSQNQVILCDTDSECSNGYKCTSSGTTHFGRVLNYCCQTRDSICSLPPNPGYGDCHVTPVTKYYFDKFELRCKPFQFINCRSINQNQFNSLQECAKFCQSTACTAGESLLLSSSNTPKTCSPKIEGSCPAGYSCSLDQLFRKHVCCGRKQDSCPLDMVSYSDPRSYFPLRCNHSSIDSCPPEFLCTGYGSDKYCCSPKFGVCPIGQSPYIHPQSSHSIKCDPLTTGSICPSQYECSPAVPGASFGFCCSIAVKAVCPTGSKPFVHPITAEPEKCTVGVTACSIGYSCQSVHKSALIGFCCSKIAKKEVSYTEPKAHPMRKTVRRRPEKKLITQNFGFTSKSAPFVEKTKKMAAIMETLECPYGGIPYYYEGTQITMECTPVEGLRNECPDASTCIGAINDIHQRSICCILPSTTAAIQRITIPTTVEPPAKSEEFVYSVTSRTHVKTEVTNDPFCPTVIEERRCVSGRTGYCPESGFFCQYNVDLRRFTCCSMHVMEEKENL